jgi:SAM-dependent methyltransferase
MSETPDLHAEQVAYWNGAGGAHWVAQQERTDRVMVEIAALVLARAAATPGETVIDIGCGCGATTLGLAESVGPAGRVIGLDVSAPMLGRARERLQSAGLQFAGNIDLVLADAASYAFPPEAADLLFSRFGVMFFGEPTQAFANLRRALKPGARLVFACWRDPAENPWMMVPLNAAYLHVPRVPRPGPEDPGPFSFADPARVHRILAGAGFERPALEAVNLSLDLAAGDGLEAAIGYVLEIGATSRALDGQPADRRAAVVAELQHALSPYAQNGSVNLGAAIWLVTATAP